MLDIIYGNYNDGICQLSIIKNITTNRSIYQVQLGKNKKIISPCPLNTSKFITSTIFGLANDLCKGIYSFQILAFKMHVLP